MYIKQYNTFFSLFITTFIALSITACSKYNNPDLSLQNMKGYTVAMSKTIEGKFPKDNGFREFRIKDKYSTWFYGMVDKKIFKLEPLLIKEMGNARKISEMKIVSYSNFYQACLKLITLWCYEQRNIVVNGKIWIE